MLSDTDIIEILKDAKGTLIDLQKSNEALVKYVEEGFKYRKALIEILEKYAVPGEEVYDIITNVLGVGEDKK